MRVVVLQPQFWPWVGVFEQLQAADVYVHFDDVQMPQGRSFLHRVQLKSPRGPQWLSVPVRRRSGQRIDEVALDGSQPWRERGLRTLAELCAGAPHLDEMLELVERVYARPIDTLCELNIAAMAEVAAYFGCETRTLRSSAHPSDARGSERLLEIVRALGGSVYLTGHGAKNYLDHELFERHGVRVEYMRYEQVPYPQQHGAFTPYVSILDLVANRGREGRCVIRSGGVDWRIFRDQGAAQEERTDGPGEGV